jgi:hypothetical protein
MGHVGLIQRCTQKYVCSKRVIFVVFMLARTAWSNLICHCVGPNLDDIDCVMCGEAHSEPGNEIVLCDTCGKGE